MASLLRKVWGSVINRSGISSRSSFSSSASASVGSSSHDFLCDSGSLGAFDQIPIDIIMQILHLLGPKETARLALVCQYFRVLASDNKLWMSFLQNGKDSWDWVAFSETHLHAGPPFKMQVKPSSQPVILTIPICHCDDTESARASRKQYRDAVFSVLFDMNVHSICAIDQAVLALYAAKRISGIVVNIGFNVTSVVPVYRGKVMRDIGVELVGIGALKLTDFLKELMQRSNTTYESLYTVWTIKEKLCYVALDYEAEMKKDTTVSCEVAGEGCFMLSKERFQIGELLFQPRLGGLQVMALHRAVGLCMDHCYNSDIAGDTSWYKTVVLAGGSGCLPGLPERLERELMELLPESISEGIKVIPPPYGTDSAWFGAKIVSNVSTFTEAWCTSKKSFRQRFKRGASSIIGSW